MRTAVIMLISLVALIFFVIWIKSDTGTSQNNSNLSYATDNSMANTNQQVQGQTEVKKYNQDTTVILHTSMGDVTIELFNVTMPVTAGNFQELAANGFYDGVIFHRVIKNFMIQGGDPTGSGTGGPGYTIKDEFTATNRNDRGTIAMANAGPNTGGSQFFINLVNNNYLDTKHPVFGKVTAGMDIVDKIANVETGPGDKPLTDVVIQSVTIQ